MMTMTLDDVSYLLHLLIDGMLLSHEAITQDNAVNWMEEHLGSDPSLALVEVTKTKGAHCRFNYLRRIFKERMLALETKYGVTPEVRRLWDQVVRIYVLYLVRITLFTDKSATVVDVVYMRYIRDVDLVDGYSWGAAALAHLYRENKAARWNCGRVCQDT